MLNLSECATAALVAYPEDEEVATIHTWCQHAAKQSASRVVYRALATDAASCVTGGSIEYDLVQHKLLEHTSYFTEAIVLDVDQHGKNALTALGDLVIGSLDPSSDPVVVSRASAILKFVGKRLPAANGTTFLNLYRVLEEMRSLEAVVVAHKEAMG